MGKRRNRRSKGSSAHKESPKDTQSKEKSPEQAKLLKNGKQDSAVLLDSGKDTTEPTKPVIRHNNMSDKDQKDQSGKTFTVALIAFIVGFVLAFLIFGTGEKDTTPADTSSDTDTEMEEVMDGDTSMMEENDGTIPADGTGGEVKDLPKTLRSNISAENQVFGETVTSSVETDQVSWVVVYEDTNGVPGNILGAKLVDIGRYTVEVKLLRGTLPDRLYYVKLQADDGDHKFDLSKDLPLVNNVTGQEIMTAFRTHDGTPN